MVMEICIIIFVCKIKAGKITRGDDLMLVKVTVGWMLERVFSHRTITVWNTLSTD